MKLRLAMVFLLAIAAAALVSADEGELPKFGDALHGTQKYDDFERPEKCRQCHIEIYYQWDQSWMSKAYDSPWDEIEYFELAVAHSKKNPKFKPVADGCNGCHTPVAFMAGDAPPPRPSENSRANESVSCDVCHTITGYNESALFNFSYYVNPGRTKYGSRGGNNSPAHDLVKTDIHKAAKFCANCHNEKNPWGIWVKSTYNEWLEGPYSKEGVQCHECHMPKGEGRRALTDGKTYDDMRQHLFHGAHIESKTRGAIDVVVHPNMGEVPAGEAVTFFAHVFNQKAGHKIPTGSVEDRLLYLHVEAIDSAGTVYHLPVDKKGFEGEEYTIASKALAYQDFKEMMDLPAEWNGLPRDGNVPEGDRIFRMPYFDEQGNVTVAQWNTAKLGVDYRVGPREDKIETYTWEIPYEVAPGPVTITATLNYRLLVDSVARFLKVPEMYYKDRLINEYSTTIEVLP